VIQLAAVVFTHTALLQEQKIKSAYLRSSWYLGWSAAMAPVIMGNPERPELGEVLRNSFCRTDPTIARVFARVTFLSDNREDLASVRVPTLIVECAQDAIAPREVGAFVHARIPGSRLVTLDATGHCPQLSAPEATAGAIAAFVAGLW
jgi:sigma-B regulation protein RsbQ